MANVVEVFALIFALAIIIKLILVAISGKKWMSFVKRVYNSSRFLMLLELVLAMIVIFYLIQNMSIVQIVAGMLVGALLTGMTFAAYSKEIMPVIEKSIKKGDVLKRNWLPILAWLLVAVWALASIFI